MLPSPIHPMKLSFRVLTALLAFGAAGLPAVHGEDLSPRKEPGDWSKVQRDIQWPKLRESIEKQELGETKTLGYKTGGFYREVPEKGAVLIGFDCSMTPFKKSSSTVRGIAPVFLTQEGAMTGTVHGAEKGKVTLHPVVAKPGYAVGKITGKFDGAAMRQIRVRFDKIAGSRLDSKDSYESPWIGTYDKALVTEQSVDTSGNLPVGVAGGSGIGLDGVRIVFLPAK